MIAEVLGVVTPVFVIAAIGYLWQRRGMPFDNATVSTLVMMVGSPCLIYSSLTRNPPETDALFTMMGIAAGAIVLGLVLAAPVIRLAGWRQTAYLPSMIHANTGNMGLPVALLAFGENGLALAMAYFFVNSISQFTLGEALSAQRFHPAHLLRQPVIWAVLVVFIVLFGEVQPPAWVDATAQLLGGLTIPAMLLMLGTSLARLNLASVRETFAASCLRLTLGVVIALIAIYALDLDGMLAGVVLLQCTMPTAVFNYVFADRYDREPDKVAAVVLQSTLLSVLTLPLMVGFALSL